MSVKKNCRRYPTSSFFFQCLCQFILICLEQYVDVDGKIREATVSLFWRILEEHKRDFVKISYENAVDIEGIGKHGMNSTPFYQRSKFHVHSQNILQTYKPLFKIYMVANTKNITDTLIICHKYISN